MYPPGRPPSKGGFVVRLHRLVLIVTACALLAAPAASFADNERATVNALRFGYTLDHLDGLFRSLPAGPMPGNATARGWVRCRFSGCENPQANALLNAPIIPLLWKGQVWHTSDTGGTLTRRPPQDSRRDFPCHARF